jgi:hypothetical protein
MGWSDGREVAKPDSNRWLTVTLKSRCDHLQRARLLLRIFGRI